MPLTPADVHNVAFKKPSIGKRGYDEDEVDAFLDVVEAELSRLIEENSELTARLTELEAGGTPAARVAPAPVVQAPVAQAPAPAPAPAAPVSSEAVAGQAARLLGLAQETADRLTDEAKAESDKLLADARSQSDALVGDATARAEAAERDSRIRAEALDAQAKARYDEAIGKLADEKVGLEKKIEDLRRYEREYRGRLKSWISDQLSQLDDNRSQPVAVVSGPGE